MWKGPQLFVLIETGCWLTPVRMGQVSLDFLVDSGSAATVISAVTFEEIARQQGFTINPSKCCLTTASGEKLVMHGEAEVELEIGCDRFRHRLIVADIANSVGILGTDFMQKYGCMLDLGQGTLQIGRASCRERVFSLV